MRVRTTFGLGLLSLAALLVGAPAQATLPIGPQIRVSHMGPDGDPNFSARQAAIAYNPAANQYLVVWSGTDTTQNEFEIWGQILDGAGNTVGGRFRISAMGPDGSTTYNASTPAIAYNPQAMEYLVVWAGDDDAAPLVADEHEIFGQRLTASGVPVGADDFRISDAGPNGDTTFLVEGPAVAYNSQANEYLVVWGGEDDTPPLVANELEIFGQLLSATGAEIGPNDFRISEMGPDGGVTYTAGRPDLVYNPQANQYLVVWPGDDDRAPINGEDEIFGQLLAADGTQVGTNDFLISDAGPDGNTNFGTDRPSVAYNGQQNEYLVTWEGDDDTPPLVLGDWEIHGQRLAADGAEVGANDFRISDMGPDGSGAYDTEFSSAAYNPVAGEYLVAWASTDDAPSLSPSEREVYGQRLSGLGVELGTNDFRISQMGPDGNPSFDGDDPAVAYGTTPNEYLVVWEGDNDVSNEFEIWARRTGAGAAPPPAGPCTITGTAGNDVLTGTPGADRICALGGNDRVFGLGGNDRILLGAGRDRAFGGKGRDEILGGNGADRISGGPGRDRLFGQRGRDVLLARDRVRDLVHGGRGFDRARVDRRDRRRSIERLF